MKTIMDTSALISLEVADLIKKSFQITEIYIPPTIVEELREMCSYKDKEGQAAKNLLAFIKKGKIKETKIKEKEKVKSLLSTDINQGEAECFVSCLENQIKTLITDDVDAAYALASHAKVKEIDLKISVAVISELVKRNKITKDQALKAIEKMSTVREWKGGVLEVLAKKYFSEF